MTKQNKTRWQMIFYNICTPILHRTGFNLSRGCLQCIVFSYLWRLPLSSLLPFLSHPSASPPWEATIFLNFSCKTDTSHVLILLVSLLLFSLSPPPSSSLLFVPVGAEDHSPLPDLTSIKNALLRMPFSFETTRHCSLLKTLKVPVINFSIFVFLPFRTQ